MELGDQVLFLHFLGGLLISVPHFMHLLTYFHLIEEGHELGWTIQPFLKGDSYQGSVLLSVHGDCLSNVNVFVTLGNRVHVQVTQSLALTDSNEELFGEEVENTSVRHVEGLNSTRDFNQLLERLGCLGVGNWVISDVNVLYSRREGQVVNNLLKSLSNARVVFDSDNFKPFGSHETISNKLSSLGSQITVR